MGYKWSSMRKYLSTVKRSLGVHFHKSSSHLNGKSLKSVEEWKPIASYRLENKQVAYIQQAKGHTAWQASDSTWNRKLTQALDGISTVPHVLQAQEKVLSRSLCTAFWVWIKTAWTWVKTVDCSLWNWLITETVESLPGRRIRTQEHLFIVEHK